MDTGLGMLTFTLKYLSLHGAYRLDCRSVYRYTIPIWLEKKVDVTEQPHSEVIQRHQPKTLGLAGSLVITVQAI